MDLAAKRSSTSGLLLKLEPHPRFAALGTRHPQVRYESTTPVRVLVEIGELKLRPSTRTRSLGLTVLSPLVCWEV